MELTDALEYKDEYGYTYKSDTRARNTLNKLLSTKFKKVFRQVTCYSKQWGCPNIDHSSETFYVLTSSDKLIKFTNSEWASMREVHTK